LEEGNLRTSRRLSLGCTGEAPEPGQYQGLRPQPEGAGCVGGSHGLKNSPYSAELDCACLPSDARSLEAGRYGPPCVGEGDGPVLKHGPRSAARMQGERKLIPMYRNERDR